MKDRYLECVYSANWSYTKENGKIIGECLKPEIRELMYITKCKLCPNFTSKIREDTNGTGFGI